MSQVDLLYLACNRREFVEETFPTMVSNTDWKLVRELFVIDDGSTDGADRYLKNAIKNVPTTTTFLQTKFKSPVAAQNHFFSLSSAPMLAKLDNDAMVPPKWLEESLSVFEKNPNLHLLGLEAFYYDTNDQSPRHFKHAQFMSGIGLYKRETFVKFGTPHPYNQWFGLEEWQMANPGIVKGWICPSLPVFLLDRIPFSPWKDYAAEYVKKGWQRSWSKYDVDSPLWKWRWPEKSIFATFKHIHPGL